MFDGKKRTKSLTAFLTASLFLTWKELHYSTGHFCHQRTIHRKKAGVMWLISMNIHCKHLHCCLINLPGLEVSETWRFSFWSGCNSVMNTPLLALIKTAITENLHFFNIHSKWQTQLHIVHSQIIQFIRVESITLHLQKTAPLSDSNKTRALDSPFKETFIC
jgi:hypothetical protein